MQITMMPNRSGPQGGRPKADETADIKKVVLFYQREWDRLMAALPQGAKPGTWMHDVVMEAVAKLESGSDSGHSVVLHLSDEERNGNMRHARYLGHENLAIFVELLLERLAGRSSDEVADIVLGRKPQPKNWATEIVEDGLDELRQRQGGSGPIEQDETQAA
jgi:hypothetical protein